MATPPGPGTVNSDPDREVNHSVVHLRLGEDRRGGHDAGSGEPDPSTRWTSR